MEKKIFNCLNELGITFSFGGREYLKTAITMVLEKGRIPSKELYIDVAKKHKTTATRVERSIRNAIQACIDNADKETIKKYFGNTISMYNWKPSNLVFIYSVAEYIKVFEG